VVSACTIVRKAKRNASILPLDLAEELNAHAGSQD